MFTQVYDDAIAPYSNDEMELEAAIEAAQIPMKDFMLRQTREKDLQTFVSIADNPDITSPMEHHLLSSCRLLLPQNSKRVHHWIYALYPFHHH